MKLKHFFLLCTTVAFISVNTHAQSSYQQNTASSSNATATNTAVSPEKMPVIELYQALNALNKTAASQRMAVLNVALKQSYDFPAILEKTVGYRYNSLSDQEKQQLQLAFENYTATRYLSNFSNGETKFKIAPEITPASVGNDRIISTKIGDTNNFNNATEINYLVRQTSQGWKIVDVLLNGHISQVAIQRGDFSAVLAKGGTQALIDMLNQKAKTTP